jgi:hypothetical protein
VEARLSTELKSKLARQLYCRAISRNTAVAMQIENQSKILDLDFMVAEEKNSKFPCHQVV